MKNVQIANAKLIYEASKNDKLVIMVGSGVSKNSGIPTWGHLIDMLKKELPGCVDGEHDYLKLAQLHQNTFEFRDSIERVKQILNLEHATPNDIHKAIFRLNPCHIITTNYDNLIEDYASKLIGIKYSTIRRDMDIPYAPYNKFIIKMHGDFVNNNIVLTENDYQNYSNNFPLVSSLVQSIFATKTILCVGYSFSDIDLKMLLNTVKNVLKQNCPRIFMLADYSNNSVNEKYLQSQGIYPIWLDEEYLAPVDSEKVKLTGDGLQVYKQLCSLQRDLTIPNNIIDDLYGVFSKITPEFPYLVWGMRNLIPQKYYSFFNLHSTGLQLESIQIKELLEQTSSKRDLKEYLKGRKEKVDFLKDAALRNGIYKIDDLDLSKYKFYHRFFQKEHSDALDYIYKFNFKEASNRIKECASNPIKYSFVDLELPYAYWSLGFYSKAFIKYKELSEAYSRSSHHILYFLCMHSQRMLANAVRYENIFDELSEIDKELEAIRNVDFDKLIESLNIPTNLKSVLKDISNFGMYLDVLTESKRLEKCFLEEKQNAENGGCSYNNNINILYSNVFRVFCFSNTNYVISTNNQYANEVFRSGISGLLLSHSIKVNDKKNGHFQQPKLQKIDKLLVVLMIFSLESNDLEKIFKDYSIESIDLTEDAIHYLSECIDNILTSGKSTWSKDNLKRYIKMEKFSNQLSNLMLICRKATNQISNINKFVDILINNSLINWRDDAPSKNFRLLLVEEKIDLTEEQANTIFEMFEPKDWGERPLVAVSDYMSKHSITLTNTDVSFLRERNENSFNIAAVVYPIATQAVKEQIEKWILESDFNIFDQNCWLIFWGISRVYNCDKIVIRTSMDAYLAFRSTHSDKITDQAIVTARYIAAIAKTKGKDGIVASSMDAIDDDLYRFFISPNSVDDNKIEPIWIFYLDNEQLKEYLSVSNHKSVAKKLIDKNDADAKYLAKKINELFLAE